LVLSCRKNGKNEGHDASRVSAPRLLQSRSAMRRDNVKRTNLPLEVIEQQARSLKSGLEKIVGGIHSGWDARRRSR
jgi:hypothetical protein